MPTTIISPPRSRPSSSIRHSFLSRRRPTSRLNGGDLMRRAGRPTPTTANMTARPYSKRVRELCATLRRHAAYEPRCEALPAFLRKSTSIGWIAHSIHMQKKALVDLLDRGCERLELSINFHVCLDCHAFMRSAARHLRRPIVVREPRMVHHFGADGVCSCGEGWRWEARTAARASSPMAAPLALGSRLDS